MFLRPATFILALFACSVYSMGQTDPFNAPRMLQPAGHEMFNSLRGNVVTADNKPVQNARVELRNGNGFSVSSAYTNSAGTFEFSQVPAGTYEVVASSGLNETHERIQVGSMPSNLVLRLPVGSAANDGNGSTSVSVAAYKVPDKARSALKKAREASEKGKNEEAERQVAKALELYPKYADALTLRALLKMDARNLDGAVDDLQQAVADDGNCAMAYLVLGAIFNTQTKFDDAIRMLQRGEALAPSSWQAYFEMGRALVGKAQYELALRQLERAQTLAPKDYPPIHMVKAHAMFGLNDYADALTELQAYLAQEPQGPRTAEAERMLSQAKAFADRGK